jgi:hypothetical protein
VDVVGKKCRSERVARVTGEGVAVEFEAKRLRPVDKAAYGKPGRLR